MNVEKHFEKGGVKRSKFDSDGMTWYERTLGTKELPVRTQHERYR